MHRKRPEKQGIELKKKFGQHFLQDHYFIDQIIAQVQFSSTTNVFEIGCGEGVLTKAIALQPLHQLKIFEIDPEWANLVKKHFKNDPRVTMFLGNILDQNLNELFAGQTWVLLANLPYCITFPILHLLYQSRSVVSEGVIMIQEEVAQKIVQKSGRGYGYPSLFFQHYFDWKVLDKVPPTAFYPAPKVFSRLLHFKTKKNPEVIVHEADFWKFIKMCFLQPRRTLKNNLQQSKYWEKVATDLDHAVPTIFTPELLQKRAQELSMDDFLKIWQSLHA
jgi:16S rRNA (adenine1518-N6/adenine1519-N6)-dimethyltransferase